MSEYSKEYYIKNKEHLQEYHKQYYETNKEHIAKNKATFFGSLTEGQFSWFTQDTDQQIGSEKENTIPVYMFDDKGKYWFEPIKASEIVSDPCQSCSAKT